MTTASESSIIHAYTDADWGGDLDDRKSTTGYVVFVFDSPVSWLSKKQAVTSLSTAESELYAITSVVKVSS